MTVPGEAGPQTPAAARRIAVVGAGISGLVAARDLARAGFDVEVFEGSDRVGGALASHRLAGIDLDAGAEAFANRSDTVPALLRELGLEPSIVAPYPSPAWLQLPDLAAPIPATGILGIPGDPHAGDVRAALGPTASARAAEDLGMPLGRWAESSAGGAAGVSVAELVRDRMGQAVVDRLVAPIVAGVHSADPEALDVEAAAPGLFAAMVEHGSLARGVAAMRAQAPAGAAVSSLRGGMHSLVSAVVSDLEAHGGRVHVSSPVRDLGQIEADRVVLAVDAPAAAELLQTRPDLRAAAHGVAATTDASPNGVALVTLVVDHPGLDSRPRGTGILVSPQCLRESGVFAKAMTHASAKWTWLQEALPAGRHVLRLSYGRVDDPAGAGPERGAGRERGAGAGAGARIDAASSDEELLRAAPRDAERLLDLALPPGSIVDADVVRWTRAVPRSAPGHAERVAGVREELRRVDGDPAVSLIGTWFSGTGLVRVIGEARAVAAEISATVG
jgi:oxygen-dependent protoporphyrinogen oxidase